MGGATGEGSGCLCSCCGPWGHERGLWVLLSRASGDRGEVASVCPVSGQLLPGSRQLGRPRSNIVRASDFSRETRNQDFPMIPAINSNIYKRLGKQSKPVGCMEDHGLPVFGVQLRDAKRTLVLCSGRAVETEEGHAGSCCSGCLPQGSGQSLGLVCPHSRYSRLLAQLPGPVILTV